ncbi:hypothetical protein NDU88_002868 [Pleurodeles waltl]|uniref:Uncharacterized protein n=1 Tax=Pleurodeles waltl TaxID=8319 RepID=A0AAV7T3M8_PLEWA|nr:hypothetical protein NDU88_002868 [Pleurodeles waltl]
MAAGPGQSAPPLVSGWFVRGLAPAPHGSVLPVLALAPGHHAGRSPPRCLPLLLCRLTGRRSSPGPQAGRAPGRQGRPPCPHSGAMLFHSGRDSLVARIAPALLQCAQPPAPRRPAPGSGQGTGRRFLSLPVPLRPARQGHDRAPRLPGRSPRAPTAVPASIAPGSARNIRMITGPSGARRLCVRHLRLLGHAPLSQPLVVVVVLN